MSRPRNSFVVLGAIGVLTFGLTGARTSPAQLAAAPLPPNVVAKIGDRVITVEDITKKLRVLPDTVRERLTKGNNLRAYVKAMVDKDLYAREAERLGLDKDPGVRARLEEARRNVLYGALQAHLLKDVTVTEAEMTAYFEARGALYSGKSYQEMKPKIAEQLRETKERQIAEKLQREASARWPVSWNEAALESISIPKGQWRQDIDRAIEETERRTGPLPEETKQRLREGTPTVVPPTPRR